VEYYFGFQNGKDDSDLTCQNYRSRDRMFDQSRHALEFFYDNRVPFWDMMNENERLGSSSVDPAASNWCLAQKHTADYLVVYLRDGGTDTINLNHDYVVFWYNPKTGGSLVEGEFLASGESRSLGDPPDTAEPGQDWLVLLERDS
jgi:Putative collagen-binding domain of a collagenase